MLPSVQRLIAVMLFIIFATACTKEKQGSSPANDSLLTKNSVTINTTRFANPAGDKTTGIIAGVVLPVESKASVYAYNDYFISSPVYIDVNGDFRVDALRPGGYTVLVYPLNNQFHKKEIYKVEVSAGTVTDLGIIILD